MSPLGATSLSVVIIVPNQAIIAVSYLRAFKSCLLTLFVLKDVTGLAVAIHMPAQEM